MRLHLSSLFLAATLVLAAPATALAAPVEGMGTADLAIGGQLVGGHGFVGQLNATADIELMELSARLAAPGNFTSFFTAEADTHFVGHVRRFLPFIPGDLQTVAGIGASFLMQDLAATSGSSNTDIDIDLFMPIGLRYGFGVGNLYLRAEALYHFPGVYLWQGKGDLSHWHYGLDARAGTLMGGVFYETGAVYNGPGAHVGLVF